MTLCKCGCGQETKPGNIYINGHYWTGKIRSEEHSRNISQALTGRHLTAETKAKMSQSHMGHETSDETRQKISQSELGPKNHRFIDGRDSVLNKHHDHRKQECIFGCDSDNYVLHHEPPYENILVWEGRLINLCASCHKRIHNGSLVLPEDVGVLWTKEDTKALII